MSLPHEQDPHAGTHVAHQLAASSSSSSAPPPTASTSSHTVAPNLAAAAVRLPSVSLPSADLFANSVSRRAKILAIVSERPLNRSLNLAEINSLRLSLAVAANRSTRTRSCTPFRLRMMSAPDTPVLATRIALRRRQAPVTRTTASRFRTCTRNRARVLRFLTAWTATRMA